jgi:hypothetical protein
MTLTLHHVFVFLVAGALLIPDRRRALALVGVVAAGIAIAAFTVRLGDGAAAGIVLRAAERGAPAAFLRINAGLLFLGLLVALVACGVSLWQTRVPAALLATLAMAFASVFGLRAVQSLAAYVNWTPILGAALALGATAITLTIICTLAQVGMTVDWLDRRLLEPRPLPLIPSLSCSADYAWFVALLFAALAVCLAPTLRAVALAAVVAATLGHVLLRRQGGGTAVPVLPLLSLFMVPVVRFAATIMATANPRLLDLINGPFSPAAEMRIMVWVGIVAWGFSGLWPLHGVVPAIITPLAGVLLLRLGAHAFPMGVDHWGPLFMPVVLLGLWHAAATVKIPGRTRRRTASLLLALALFGILAGGPGVSAGYWLLVAAVAFPWLSAAADIMPPPPWGLGRIIW